MGLYVYAIGRADDAPPPAVAGILGALAYRVASGRLAAIVSDCSLATLRAERRHIAASQQALTASSSELDLLPMAFGTIVPSSQALCRFLDEHREMLGAQLDRVAGKREMELRLTLDVANPIAFLVGATPALKAARDRAVRRGRIASYNERIRFGQLCEEALRRYREGVIATVSDGLAPACAEISILPPAAEEEVAHLAALVARDGIADFEAAVERTAAGLPDVLVVRLAGPFPPHNFVQLEL